MRAIFIHRSLIGKGEIMSREYEYTQNREISWLRFNQRVLEEALDPTVPLMERMKFVEIFTSNLNEFFMIRVGSLSDLALLKDEPVDNKSGLTATEQLQAVFRECVPLYKQRDRIYSEVETELSTCNICRLKVDELKGKQRKQVENWFQKNVLPVLSPQLIDMHHPFPHLANDSLNIILKTIDMDQVRFGIIPIPKHLPKFVQLDEVGVHYVLLEDIILEYADQVFQSVTVLEKTVVRVTRNADVAPEDEAYEVEEDFRSLMRKVVRKRTRLAPVRLEIQGKKFPEIQEFLCRKLGLPTAQVFYTKAPIDLSYIYEISDLLSPESRAALCDAPYTPKWPVNIDEKEKLIPQFLAQDAMLFYPFESMDPFLQLIREAANSPDVLSIKITIYRLARRAKLAEYLCAAAENGKDVTVLMELRARFDEQNNIEWAERLEEAGCTILYGAEGIKVHSKVCLITLRSGGEVRYITQVGTGNYHEKTAKLYTDLSLITADPVIGGDAAQLFQNLATVNYNGNYQKLLASPFKMREKVLELIDKEIEKGSEGYIFFKLNSLSDRVIIDKIEEASRAGVEVVMNIRGICCLLPGVKGHTENVKVFSIVGRYLEHTRIYRFGRGDDSILYISSADFMTRNMIRRVEIACPVEDPHTRAKLFKIMDELQKDNVKARIMDSSGIYNTIDHDDDDRICQLRFMQLPLEEPLPKAAEPKSKGGFLAVLKRIFGGKK